MKVCSVVLLVFLTLVFCKNGIAGTEMEGSREGTAVDEIASLPEFEAAYANVRKASREKQSCDIEQGNPPAV